MWGCWLYHDVADMGCGGCWLYHDVADMGCGGCWLYHDVADMGCGGVGYTMMLLIRGVGVLVIP